MKLLNTLVLLSLSAAACFAAKISDYGAVTSLADTQLLLVTVPGVTNYKMTVENFRTALGVTGATNFTAGVSNLMLTSKQPASSILTNLANKNGTELTNLNPMLNASPIFSAVTRKSVIFDSDHNSDCDDVASQVLLLAFEKVGYFKVLGMGVCTSNRYSGEAMRAVNCFYGRSDIPIGTNSASTTSGYDDGMAAVIATNWFDGMTATPSAGIEDVIPMYRRLLANAANNSVTMIFGGQLKNLYDLYGSTADTNSGLSGAALMESRCAELVFVAGDYPTGNEYNLTTDWVSAQAGNWITNLTIPVTWFGYTEGTKLKTGGNFYVNHPIDSPIRRAFIWVLEDSGVVSSSRAIDGRWFWGDASVAWVAWGTNFFTPSAVGFNYIVEGGSNYWTESGAHNQRWLSLNSATTNKLRAAIANLHNIPSAYGHGPEKISYLNRPTIFAGTNQNASTGIGSVFYDSNSPSIYFEKWTNGAPKWVGSIGIDGVGNSLALAATNEIVVRFGLWGQKFIVADVDGAPLMSTRYDGTVFRGSSGNSTLLRLDQDTKPNLIFQKGGSGSWRGLIGISGSGADAWATGSAEDDMVIRTAISGKNVVFADGSGNIEARVVTSGGLGLPNRTTTPTGDQVGANGCILWCSNAVLYVTLSANGSTVTTKALAP